MKKEQNEMNPTKKKIHKPKEKTNENKKRHNHPIVCAVEKLFGRTKE